MASGYQTLGPLVTLRLHGGQAAERQVYRMEGDTQIMNSGIWEEAMATMAVMGASRVTVIQDWTVPCRILLQSIRWQFPLEHIRPRRFYITLRRWLTLTSRLL